MNTNGHEEKMGAYAARVRISAARRTEARWLSPLLPRKGGEGRGEEAVFHQFFPSLQLSPRSFLAGREGKTPQRFYAEHYWCPTTWARTRERLPRSHIDSAGRNTDHKESTFRRPERPSGIQYGASGNPIANSGGPDARLYGRREARYNPNSFRFSSHDASTGRSGTFARSIACSSAPALSGKPTWPPSAAERCNASMISAP